MHENWYRNGLRFTCQRCGECCWDEGDYTEVYVTDEDIERLADFMQVYPSVFRRRYTTKSDGYDVLKTHKGACILLQDKGCRAYEARPVQCRTWPFWPENLSRHMWYGEVRKRCPGVGRGRKYSEEEIEQILLTKCPVS